MLNTLTQFLVIQQDDFLQQDRVILEALLFLLRPIKGGKE